MSISFDNGIKNKINHQTNIKTASTSTTNNGIDVTSPSTLSTAIASSSSYQRSLSNDNYTQNKKKTTTTNTTNTKCDSNYLSNHNSTPPAPAAANSAAAKKLKFASIHNKFDIKKSESFKKLNNTINNNASTMTTNTNKQKYIVTQLSNTESSNAVRNKVRNQSLSQADQLPVDTYGAEKCHHNLSAPISMSAITLSSSTVKTANPATTNRDKFKSKSYLINSKSITDPNASPSSIPSNASSASLNIRKFLFAAAVNQHQSASSSQHAYMDMIDQQPQQQPLANATISGIKTKKLANMNIIQSNLSAATCFLNSAKKKRSSLFNLFSFKNGPSTATASATAPATSSLALDSDVSRVVSMSTSTQNDDSVENFSMGEDETFANNSTPVSPPSPQATYHHRLVKEEQQQRFSFDNPHPTMVYQKLERAKSELIKVHTNHNVRPACDAPEANRPVAKKPSIRSKGFSIPLNASYCLNSIPVNCMPHLSLNTNVQLKQQPSPVNQSQQYLADSLQFNAQQMSDVDYDDLKNNENLLLPFQKKSFDLEEENSCLKEVNMRLRFAQVKNYENLKFSTTNSNSSTDEVVDYGASDSIDFSQIKKSEANLTADNRITQQDPFFSPSSSSVLTLSVRNNQYYDDENFTNDTNHLHSNNSSELNALDQLNDTLNMSSQHNCDSTTRESNVIANREMDKSNESKELTPISIINSKKKRFQQFQTRSLINLNGQLKKSPLVQTNHDEHKQPTTTQQSTTTNSDIITNGSSSKPNQSGMKTNPCIKINNDFYDNEQQMSASTSSSSLTIHRPESPNIANTPTCIYLVHSYSKETTTVDVQLVECRKGIKLRDLIKPVLDEQQMNIDQFEFYKLNNHKRQHSSEREREHENSDANSSVVVDLDSNCEQHAGSEIYLKYKNTTTNSQSTSVQKPTSLSNSKVAANKSSTNNFLIIPNQSGAGATAGAGLKMRKSSLQIPAEQLAQAGLLTTQCASSAASTPTPDTKPAIVTASSNSTSSTVNWQNYFNSKLTKDKLTSKQKRNSCIAVMNEFSAIPSLAATAAAGAQTQNGTAGTPTSGGGGGLVTLNVPGTPNSSGLSNNSATSITARESFGFFHSYVQSSSSTSTLSPVNTVGDRRGKKNFKHIAQISSIFANVGTNVNKNNENNKLAEKLTTYLKELPKLPHELGLKTYEPSILDIETDWNKFVGEATVQSLPIKVAKQQMAIWELFTTECSHIKTIKVIIDVFLSCLLNLKSCESTSEFFKDIDIKKLFCNIIDVFNCNLTFWQKYLHPLVVNSKSTGCKIIDPYLLVNAFSEFQTLFAPYEEFILERNFSTDYFKQKCNENDYFLKFIMWAENHPLVGIGRLKIADFMMIPVQRLTKYQLLIENIYQHTEDEAKREKIAQIKDTVNGLPNSINIKLNYIAQFNEISESIEKYEGILGPTDEVTELLGEFKKLDIKSPLPGCPRTSVRELIHQGPLKLKDIPKSIDVYCFLFTDMLLITQQKKTKKYKIIKPPVCTNRMIVKELTQTDKAFVVISLNDYNVPDSVNMFISAISRKWIECLELSKKKYLVELEKHKSSSSTSTSSSNSSSTSSTSSSNNLDDAEGEFYQPVVCLEPDTIEPVVKLVVEDEDNNNSNNSGSNNNEANRPPLPMVNQLRRSSAVTIVQTVDTARTISENETNANSPSDISSSSSSFRKQDNVSDEIDEKDEMLEEMSELDKLEHLNDSSSGGVSRTSSTKSALLESKSENHHMPTTHGGSMKYQKQPGASSGLRLIDRRIERQRRNMTDPTQHVADEQKHQTNLNNINIIKRNSLNDKPSAKQAAANGTTQEKLINSRGDSTSTILSTDSGVSSSSNCLDTHCINNSHESVTVAAASPVRNCVTQVHTNLYKVNIISPSSPTSSSSFSSASPTNDPQIYSNLSVSTSCSSTSSSSSAASSNLRKTSVDRASNHTPSTLIDENEDQPTVDEVNGLNEDFYDDDDVHLDLEESANHKQLPDEPANNNNNSYMFRKQNNFRIKQSENINKIKLTLKTHNLNQQAYDLNNNNTTSEYYDYVSRTPAVNDPITPTVVKTPTQQQPQQQQQPPVSQLRKPLIKIKSTVIKNESVRANAAELVYNPANTQTNGNNKQINFDSTVDSAQANLNAASAVGQTTSSTGATNISPLDNHHRMILVNLIHATMDATEV